MKDLKKIFEIRREKIYSFMKKNKIDAAIFEDGEEKRNVAVRYLCGHPGDAALILFNGKSFLIPWDENLAVEKSFADEMIPSEKFSRSNVTAAKEILNGGKNLRIELSEETPLFKFRKFCEEFPESQIVAEKNGVHDFLKECRAVKDDYEIECTKKACALTDSMTSLIIENLRNKKISTEADVALFAEKELRLGGAEKTSFDTLAAGADRSFAIHAFPGYTNSLWGGDGLSILDYGVCVEGYASDCTITVAKNISAEQKKLLDLVEEVAEECKSLYAPGQKISAAVKNADEIFARADRRMPHGLGHGIGLEIHEEPFVSLRSAEEKKFSAGNIVTLEPGLYDKNLGGVRLENDVLITTDGNEILTHSKIFRM